MITFSYISIGNKITGLLAQPTQVNGLCWKGKILDIKINACKTYVLKSHCVIKRIEK